MNPVNLNISQNLKNLRKTRGWSLDKTAAETGVSKAMLGQIERLESSPTIATLWKVACGFRVPFSSFLEKPSATTLITSPQVSHFDDQFHNPQILVKTLFPFDPELRCDVFRIELLPGYEHLSPPHEKDVIEQVLMVSGTLEVFIEGKWQEVSDGNGVKFRADVPHGYRNMTAKSAIFHDVIHYPPKTKRTKK
jgi:transcriptional regulator with XRE-family HTH domain